ncbi:hypothetical protein TrVE_jg12426 [Triparma verrucosa]|uniref:Uncharacterized protein n=1 Tax=Triparma verrucosa TaxID=1606542 RepID=A0A9W7CFJ8_9STRA|nr:hypothetical protein TrVE_jg12426 [Triparma verrucosa]
MLKVGDVVGKTFTGFGYWEGKISKILGDKKRAVVNWYKPDKDETTEGLATLKFVDVKAERLKKRNAKAEREREEEEKNTKRQKVLEEIEMIDTKEFGLYSDVELSEEGEGSVEEEEEEEEEEESEREGEDSDSNEFPSTVVLHHEGDESKAYPYGFYNKSKKGVTNFKKKQPTKPAVWGTKAGRRLLYMRADVTVVDKEGTKRRGKSYIWSCWPGPADLVCVDTVTVEHLAHKDKEKLGDFPSTTYLPLTGIKARPVHMVSPVADFAGCMQVDDQISSVNPWIYGGCFNFSMPSDGCLGKLKVGSVVYFGSVQGGEMVLDTVFVVGGFYDTDKMTKEKSQCNAVLGGERLEAHDRGRMGKGWNELCNRPCLTDVGELPSKRIYIGATHDKPVNGMYSYVVTKREASGGLSANLHARSSISIDGVLNNSSNRILKKFLRCPDEDPELGYGVGVIEDMYDTGVRTGYDEILKQVYESGAFPGSRVELPEASEGSLDGVLLREGDWNGQVRESEIETWEYEKGFAEMHLLNEDGSDILTDGKLFTFNGEFFRVTNRGLLAGPQLVLDPYPADSKKNGKKRTGVILDLRERQVRLQLKACHDNPFGDSDDGSEEYVDEDEEEAGEDEDEDEEEDDEEDEEEEDGDDSDY